MTSWYAHLSRIAVRRGACVAAGTRLGAVGSTGESTGPHLHFELRLRGAAVDPSGSMR
jgi:murein DD-endopeptidase MepM/ murein hydrolase activator NlpD